MPSARLSTIAILLLLTACGGQEDTGPERKTAAGEVLGGSISDAMLPLDTVQSQSPPLRESVTGKGDGEATGTADESADTTDDATPVASASPSSAPSAAAGASATPQAEN
jgi:hypothetical protein